MMGKLSSNQQGFSAIEAILIIVIVGLVGFTGWYVYHAQQTTNKALAPSTSTTPKFKKITKTVSSKPSPTTTSRATTFKISELGIELVKVPPSIADLTDYEFASSTGVDSNNTTTSPVKSVSVQFSTQSLSSADPACSAKDGTSIGALARTNGTYVNKGPKDDTAFVKQFSGFYITYSHPQAACSNSSSAEALHQTQTTTFQTLALNAENLQAL